MKNYFLAILLGSLFSCPLFSIGIMIDQEKLLDFRTQTDEFDVVHERYDHERRHYLVRLMWTDYEGNQWSRAGRLAAIETEFDANERDDLICYCSYTRKNTVYFLPSQEPIKIGSKSRNIISVPRNLLPIVRRLSYSDSLDDSALAENTLPNFEHASDGNISEKDDAPDEDSSEVDGAAADNGDDYNDSEDTVIIEAL